MQTFAGWRHIRNGLDGNETWQRFVGGGPGVCDGVGGDGVGAGVVGAGVDGIGAGVVPPPLQRRNERDKKDPPKARENK